MAAGATQLKFFEIKLPSGGLVTRELYNNGRHQCRVSLLVTKQVQNEQGNWIDTPLNRAETESATVTGFGVPAQPLPAGWACDVEKNEFDAGLWSRAAEGERDSDGCGSAETEPEDTSVELIPRYMRAEATVRDDPVRFMGRITVGGKVYTTYGTYGVITFNTYVDIFPTRAYRLFVRDLTEFVDINAFHGTVANNLLDIDVYYWMPPSGLQFKKNLGLDDPIYVTLEGAYFQTSFIYNYSGGNRKKGGIIWKKDTLGLQLRIDDVQLPSGHNPFVEFNRYPTIMRALRYQGWIDSRNNERMSPWRLLDNFGCEHVFVIDYGDNRNLLRLRDHGGKSFWGRLLELYHSMKRRLRS
ncbi:hypothetical protein C4J95_1018 [Pseudomonas orientalis]|uniref:hypothetical protein n=1 Tax=Pseudomonas orientalis TaxID=76758 RepID=UPI000F58DC4C|nr:hypothetical protein [Pseudomonas orientalis]AZE98496.1 hypothetical protein C4J95_1018 [Pseudomonas orientalis]